MREELSIKKEKIDEYLSQNLIYYINNINLNINDDGRFSFNEEQFNFRFEEVITEIQVFLTNDGLVQIERELETQEFNFKDLATTLDINKDKQIDNIELIRTVKYMLAARATLKLQTIMDIVSQPEKNYDIFLSHCSWDAREILGLKIMLENECGYKTYVDWIEDKQANFPRAINTIINVIIELGKINPALNLKKIEDILERILAETKMTLAKSEKQVSNIIIENLKSSAYVFYIQSRHYDHSRWMPWEIGFAEGIDTKVFRVPIKYFRTRKPHGKRTGFLTRYESIMDCEGNFNKANLTKI